MCLPPSSIPQGKVQVVLTWESGLEATGLSRQLLQSGPDNLTLALQSPRGCSL